uniref:Membrane magnesium transporter 1 n=1 Tax=Podarcis muralis TaxID=64176 RepID=A0A670KB29_PODMU
MENSFSQLQYTKKSHSSPCFVYGYLSVMRKALGDKRRTGRGAEGEEKRRQTHPLRNSGATEPRESLAAKKGVWRSHWQAQLNSAPPTSADSRRRRRHQQRPRLPPSSLRRLLERLPPASAAHYFIPARRSAKARLVASRSRLSSRRKLPAGRACACAAPAVPVRERGRRWRPPLCGKGWSASDSSPWRTRPSPPRSIVLQTLLAFAVTCYGIVHIAGEFKDMDATSELKNKTFDTLRNHPSFYVFNHRGRVLFQSPDTVHSSSSRDALSSSTSLKLRKFEPLRR